jgi:perosamine synthetase
MSKKGWRFNANERKYLDETLSGAFSAGASGTMNERLEKAFAQKHGCKYAITANSGTSTLHMALHAFGVHAGDEVIIPALTVGMCGFAVCQSGATPVYADVCEDTFLMDPVDVERKITSRTKAIMPVHIYGLMCDMDSIEKIARKHHLFIVEDCAQCFLGSDSQNRIAGTIGHVGSWSFENSKHMSTGDGGIVVTNDENFAIKMRQFGGVGFKNLTASSGKVRIDRDKFQNPDWCRHNIVGYNYRLPELCAAVGLAQLERLDEFVHLRQQMGMDYRYKIESFKKDILIPQKVKQGYIHTYYTFGALFNGEKYGITWKAFRQKYIEFGGDGIYAAWKTVNCEPAFSTIGWGDVPVAEKLQKNLMQFTTNQHKKDDRIIQLNALHKTLTYFNN